MVDNVPEAVQDIVEQLLLLSESQRLIKHAKGEYINWYTNESDEMPYKPEEVQMEFWRHTLSFQTGTALRITPCITTALKKFVHPTFHSLYPQFWKSCL